MYQKEAGDLSWTMSLSIIYALFKKRSTISFLKKLGIATRFPQNGTEKAFCPEDAVHREVTAVPFTCSLDYMMHINSEWV